MVDYAVSLVQSLCLLGYLYGAWLVITHKADASPMRGREAAGSPSSHGQADDLAWRRYVAYDW
jgi:hypothetical protein